MINICKKSVVLGCAIGIAGTLIIVSIFFSFSKKQKFVYVNIEQVIANVMETISADGREKQAGSELIRYRRLFDVTIDKYSKSEDVIIFSSPKPIAGAKDVTEKLINQAFGKKEEKRGGDE